MLETRASGRPVHYILGEREFMGLIFAVDERVMIPRPETETLVEFVIETLKKPAGVGNREPCRDNLADDSGLPTPDSCLLVDVGTGSGCIAVSFAHYLRQARVYATDISRAALEVATANAQRHGVAVRVVFLEGDLLAPLPVHLRGHVDVIVANPPYVPASEAPTLARDIREFEPAVAVFAPGEGTAIHTRLIEQALLWLRPGGLLAMEVAAGQAERVRKLIMSSRRYADVRALPDLAGIERVVVTRAIEPAE